MKIFNVKNCEVAEKEFAMKSATDAKRKTKKEKEKEKERKKERRRYFSEEIIP